GQEWNSAARCRPENPRDRSFRRRSDAAGQPPPPASDCDDGTGDHGRYAAPRIRTWRRIADAAAPGNCGDRWNFDFDGIVADHHPGGAFLSEPRTGKLRWSEGRNCCEVNYFACKNP